MGFLPQTTNPQHFNVQCAQPCAFDLRLGLTYVTHTCLTECRYTTKPGNKGEPGGDTTGPSWQSVKHMNSNEQVLERTLAPRGMHAYHPDRLRTSLQRQLREHLGCRRSGRPKLNPSYSGRASVPRLRDAAAAAAVRQLWLAAVRVAAAVPPAQRTARDTCAVT